MEHAIKKNFIPWNIRGFSPWSNLEEKIAPDLNTQYSQIKLGFNMVLLGARKYIDKAGLYRQSWKPMFQMNG